MAERNGRARVPLLLLVLITVVLLAVDSGGTPGDGSGNDTGGTASRLRGAVATVVGPAQEVGATARRAVIAAWQAGRREVSAELPPPVRGRVDPADQRRRDAQLEELLTVAGAAGHPVAAARVVAVGPRQGFAWTASVDVGSSDGVQPDMSVVNSDGLVGRVVSVASSSATVLMVADPGFSVGVRMAGSGEIGVARGAGLEPMELELLDPQTTLEPGDDVVTLGSEGGRPFVPGVLLGHVSTVLASPGSLSRPARLQPAVDVTAVDLVAVVLTPSP